MRASQGISAIAVVAMFALAGCAGGGEPRLLNLQASNTGPDEFSILPTKPLELPKDLANLPEPTPGGTNITDPTPKADAIAALGGRAPAENSGASASDSALLAHATRHGIAAGIRQELAAADLEYRRTHDGRLLERLFNVNVYFKAYKPMSLDRYAELERWRRAGARTPAAPPEDSVLDN